MRPTEFYLNAGEVMDVSEGPVQSQKAKGKEQWSSRKLEASTWKKLSLQIPSPHDCDWRSASAQLPQDTGPRIPHSLAGTAKGDLELGH
ncbi:Hypothetical predicted protein [Marmota monax]|uniref:Uncharacterized protein n=1 Tax=Marmota monax TaxID=9995 RepID=A0A5E4AR83_MARMO|nr:hypothetical protein GHT09_003595 [Marmota monax]VTJ59169.1 Hypothetical predicted protein [Marmota monax]